MSTSRDTRTLLDNVVALGLLQAASFLLPLATLPYLARVLGPGRFGLVAFAQSTLQYVIVLTDFGFNVSATRAISVRRDDPEAVSAIFSSVLALKSLLALAGAALLAMGVLLTPSLRAEWRLFAAAYAIVMGNVAFPVWFFQGIERMRFVAALTVLSKLSFTLLVFTVVRTDRDYFLVPLLNGAGAIVAGGLSLWFALGVFRVRLRIPSWLGIRQAFRESIGYFLSRASVTVYTASNVFVLGLMTAPAVVGLYSSAEKIYGAMQSVYSPVTSALLPYMARTRNRALFLRITVVTSLANAAACAFLIGYAEPIVRIAFGPAYAGSSIVLRLLATAMIFVLPTFLLGYPFLAAFGHAAYANGSTIAGSALHLAGLFVLVALGRITPANVAGLVVATEAFVFAIRLYAVYRTRIWKADLDVTGLDRARAVEGPA